MPASSTPATRRGTRSWPRPGTSYGVSGNRLSRDGLDAFRARALADPAVSHLFVPHRDRIARPDNPVDAMVIEFELRAAGLAIVLMNGPQLLPLPPGQRMQLADLLTTAIDYDNSGRFRESLAVRLVQAKVMLAQLGVSIGGEPPYGFRRLLCAGDGTPQRELSPGSGSSTPGTTSSGSPRPRTSAGWPPGSAS